MSAPLSTSNRMYFLTLQDYGEDDLLIDEMSGHEELSTLFEFRLRLFSEHSDIDPVRIIGKWAILRVETWDSRHMEGERHWNGYVSRFASAGRIPNPSNEQDLLYVYECDIVPWFWFMTQNEDCRIFQNLSVPDIVETIFAEFGYSDYKLELVESHPQLEYCTQYHETTFAFISRLLEREGIYYYFRHNEEAGESRHILVFTDNNDSNPALDPSELPFHDAGHAADFDAIRSLRRSEKMRTRRVTLHDWDYSRKNVVGENTPTVLSIGADRDLERYRYPGGFVAPQGESDSDTGKRLSQVLMEAEEAGHMRLRGESQVRTLAPGHTFTLYDHPENSLNAEYMVAAVWHHGRNNLMGSEGAAAYGNEFALLPRTAPFRAPLATRRTRMYGPQTAIVTGPPGEEIHTDEHGRIKVRFHWDRRVPGRQTNSADDRASCWIRVAQMWAGNGYGTMFLPRIGMEVVVDFLEGDPDRPLVTGCVYNGVNRPPYPLPAEATKSTIKTLSSKGGGGTNEIRFEDKKGSEELFLQAQKDMNVLVKNASTVQIDGKSSLMVGGDTVEEFKGKVDINAHADWSQAVEGSCDLVSKGFLYAGSARDGAKFAALNDVSLYSKSGKVQMTGPMGVVAESAAGISLKSGESFISINPGGVFISGPVVMINSGGTAMTYMDPGGDMALANAAGVTATQDGRVTDPLQQLQAQALRNAAASGAPFCAECEAARLALEALQAAS